MNVSDRATAFQPGESPPLPDIDTVCIGVIGLGYVGLPVATHMARHFPVVGFDVSGVRVSELAAGTDRTREVTENEFRSAKRLTFSTDRAALKECNFFIVTVPTPIDAAKRPDLTALERASATVGKVLKRGDVVVYESTVYPGATEEVCVPILEAESGLRLNVDFSAGYSPERINPGDKTHRFPDIVKVTSGSNPAAARLVRDVYGKAVAAGTHPVSSIRVAEAAKVIENIQRDANIALINELAMLFKHLGLETREVLDAAGTKWNFHKYLPGLVGGHCIGVDPYYLTYKAQSVGFHPDMILAGRRINDNMAMFIAQDIVKSMLQRKLNLCGARVLVAGFTFKENCPDLRNTKVADLVVHLKQYALDVLVYDPLASPEEAMDEYSIAIANRMPDGPFEAIVLAVNHDDVKSRAGDIHRMLTNGGLLYDVKGVLPVTASHARI
jgi:UDP-N-acetyl-D-galactosamine dehydrogenase